MKLSKRLSSLFGRKPRNNQTKDEPQPHYWGEGLLDDILVVQEQLNERKQTNYDTVDFTDIENYERNILERIETKLEGKVSGTEYNKNEMNPKERGFLNGIIRKTKPKNIMEMGLSAGGSSCVILNAIGDIDDAKLYSFDYNTSWYRCDGKSELKTGFLVKQIVPEQMSKWELYTGGVACKYFDFLPEDGIDLAFIDTVHHNPGEFLNILEILPYMKKNGIVILHDTAYHIINAVGITNCVTINTLVGKRIHLKTEYTTGLPNIAALVLGDITQDMIWSLFTNISLPWAYKISKEDFVEMYKHYGKFYSHEMLKIYIYYCIFYMNGGHNNRELALRAAEVCVMRWQKLRIQLVRKDIENERTVVAMINHNSASKPTETFIRLQREKINAKINYYSDGMPPTYLNGIPLISPYSLARLEIAKQQNAELSEFNEKEIHTALSLIDENTDVVFAQFGTTGANILNVCKLLKLPLIVHFHGFDISVRTLIENYRQKYLEMFKYADFVIAVSKYMQNSLINLRCPPEKIILNPCVANGEYYNIQPTFSKRLFVGAGRFIDKKAPQNTILAFKKVLERYPDAKLILAGDGKLFEECRNLVRKKRMESSVLLPGEFKPEQLKEWFSDAIAFVQHSVTAPDGDMEGTPVVVCEASLAGLPVISTFHAGIPDVIIDGKTGLLVQENDIDAMAEKMIWVIDNPEKAKAMGAAGKKNISENFNEKKHIEKLNEIVYKVTKTASLRNTSNPLLNKLNASVPELTPDEKMIIDYVIDNKLTMTSMERLFATLMSCKYVLENDIDGDFVECGVWRGGNSIIATWIFKLYNSNRKVYLYDTFQGMTLPTDLDIELGGKQRTASEIYVPDNKWCYASIDDVKDNFSKADLLSKNVEFVQGDVLQTLDKIIPEKISVLRLDTDWYESTKKEMETLYGKISNNGVLMIDDYGHWAGSQKAVDEYFEKNKNRPFLYCIDYTGRLAIKTDLKSNIKQENLIRG